VSFVDLFHSLAEATKSSRKVELIAEYLASAPESDLGWAVHLLRGGKGERIVSTREVREWAAEFAAIPLWLFEESYHVVGDLAETTALVVLEPERIRASSYSSPSLKGWIDLLRALKNASPETRKSAIHEVWSQLANRECLVFNKLITGGLRIGVSSGLVCKALSLVVGRDGKEIAHRLIRLRDPDSFRLDLLRSESLFASTTMTPYPFFLAHPIDGGVAALGSPVDWIAEWKWDGIRAQIVCRGGDVAVWSRGEELITESFPEFQMLTTQLSQGLVLDGELVAWGEDSPAPFGSLQKRLNRRRVTPKLVNDTPVAFIAYDLLELNGLDLRQTALAERRALLSECLDGATTLGQLLKLSPVIDFATWEELEAQRAGARNLQAEGIMIKRSSSAYGVGRCRGDWWKWKVDPFSVDGVLMYAQKGHGRRADLYTDYTFGVWSDGELVPFAKAYSGLTDAELRQVDAFIKAHTKEKFGPVRTVEPRLVFEIAFEGIQPSKRHRSGVAVRFPRITRWRRDKPVSEADTLDQLLGLLPF